LAVTDSLTDKLNLRPKSFPYKNWLKYATAHRIYLQNWHPKVPSPGPDFDIHRFKQEMLEVLLRPVLDAQEGMVSTTMLSIQQWPAGEQM